MREHKTERYKRDMEKHACGGTQLLLLFLDYAQNTMTQIDEVLLHDGVEYCKAKRKFDIASNTTLTDDECEHLIQEVDSYYMNAEVIVKKLWKHSGRLK